MKAKKFDKGKARFDLIPAQVLKDVAEVFTYRAEKYGDRNYKEGKGLAYGRLFAGCNRHIWAWWNGEERDPETNKIHLIHAICCLMMLLDLIYSGKGIDDRDLNKKKRVKDE